MIEFTGEEITLFECSELGFIVIDELPNLRKFNVDKVSKDEKELPGQNSRWSNMAATLYRLQWDWRPEK